MGKYVRTLYKCSLWRVDILIFVTVGTQIPFDRLLKSVEKQIELGNIKEKVLVQAGVTNFKSDKMEIVGFIPMDEFKKIIEEAV